MHLYLRLCILLMVCAALYACATAAATPPKSQLLEPHPLLAKEQKVVLIVDVCIQRKDVGEFADYFPISEAKTLAQEFGNQLQNYLEQNDVKVNKILRPFLCGTLTDDGNTTRKIAERLGENFSESKPPFAIDKSFENDTEYSFALSKVATYIYKTPFKQVESQASMDSSLDLKPILEIVLNRTDASSMLYVVMRGISRSTEYATAEKIGRYAVGVATAIVSALIPIRIGQNMVSGYIIPGGSEDGSIIGVALFNLKSSKLEWSAGVRNSGDPIFTGAHKSLATINMLLSPVVYYPTGKLLY